VNANGTANVAVAAREVEAKHVYLSTDYVFRGDPAEAKYTERDGVYPTNYYGRTKFAGEVATRLTDAGLILRSSVIYGLRSRNFVMWALGELEEGNEIRIITDQFSTPTYAPDLARACVEAASDGLSGVYHAAGPERTSRYEFTVLIAEVFGYDPDLVMPITKDQLDEPAYRPEDCSLDSTELQDACDVRLRPPGEALKELRERMG